MDKLLIILAVATLSLGCMTLDADQTKQPAIQENEIKRTLPFPHNRLRDFYRTQARSFIAKQDRNYSRILAPFPGLDGGGWGHWGQNPESDNVDSRLNEIDFGGVVMQATNHAEGWANKGVSVQAGDYTAVFDPEKLCFVDAWEGGLPEWGNRRYGITSGVKAKGKKVGGFPSGKWTFPEKMETKYLGFYRAEGRTVFTYRIGKTQIYEWIEGDRELSYHRLIEGKLPDGVVFSGNDFIRSSAMVPKELLTPGRASWSDKSVITKGQRGEPLPDSPYVIDTLTVPYRDINPFKTPMRIGGVGVFSDGRIAVCTLMGDVWIVDGVDDTLEKWVWKIVPFLFVNFLIAGKISELFILMKNGIVNVGLECPTISRFQFKIEMKLHHRMKLGNFHKDRFTVFQQVKGINFHRVVSGNTGISYGIFRRAISSAI